MILYEQIVKELDVKIETRARFLNDHVYKSLTLVNILKMSIIKI